MATRLLHTDPIARHHAYAVDLEGSTYVVELRWNVRAGAWFMSLFDRARAPIAVGRKVVLGANLRGRSADGRLPPGTLLALDTSGSGRDATETDLGTRVLLAYVESAGAE
jgi:hypothetical protein